MNWPHGDGLPGFPLKGPKGSGVLLDGWCLPGIPNRCGEAVLDESTCGFVVVDFVAVTFPAGDCPSAKQVDILDQLVGFQTKMLKKLATIAVDVTPILHIITTINRGLF